MFWIRSDNGSDLGSLGIRSEPEAESHQDILNKLGDHEWELVSVWGERGAMYFYFKRPKVLR
jgi:hypothetical protein